MIPLSKEQRILLEIWSGNHVFYNVHLSSPENRTLNSVLSYNMYSDIHERYVLNGIRDKWMMYKGIDNG
jgi:hypothetical protein